MLLIQYTYLVDIEFVMAVEFLIVLSVSELLDTLLWLLGPGVDSRLSIAPVRDELEPLAVMGCWLFEWPSALFDNDAKVAVVLKIIISKWQNHPFEWPRQKRLANKPTPPHANALPNYSVTCYIFIIFIPSCYSWPCSVRILSFNEDGLAGI